MSEPKELSGQLNEGDKLLEAKLFFLHKGRKLIRIYVAELVAVGGAELPEKRIFFAFPNVLSQGQVPFGQGETPETALKDCLAKLKTVDAKDLDIIDRY